MSAFAVNAFAQTKSTKTAKPAAKPATKIQAYVDKVAKGKLTIDEAKMWADSLPVLVKGDNGKIYKLHSFEIAIIQKEPYLMKEFGIGMDGFPILARRAIDNMKTGDSIFLKNVMYTDEKNQDQKLPNLVVAIIDAAPAK